MPSDLRHLVDSGQTYPVVRLGGVLDGGSGSLVRAALLGVLGDQPEGLVVDVRELALSQPEAAGVLGDVASETADWPGTRLVLCADGDGWSKAGLPARPSLESAFAELGRPHPGDFLSLTLDPVVGAARRSRELVAEACGRWDLADLAGPACIVLTEMVNNVVAHARTPMSILLALRDRGLTVAVRDGSGTIPRFSGSPVPVTSYGGRGLLLIDSVAERWGSLMLPRGKVVWAALPAELEPWRPPTDARGNGSPAQWR